LKGISNLDFDPPFLKVENKFDVKGYESIISQTGIQKWTFFSDVPKEVAGAKEAGMKGYVVVREGNKPLEDSEKEEHKILNDGFVEILNLIEQ
jgi:methionine salvage enolase-phosphatase E1